MEALSVRDFRSNMAESFDRVANGENVLIRRKKELFALVRLGREDITITPELQQRIDDVHEAYKKGQCITCATTKDLDNFLNSL